jgi:hypothetical protein
MRVGIELLNQLIGHALELLQIHVAALLRLELESARIGQAADRRRPKDTHDGVLNLPGAFCLASEGKRRTERELERMGMSSSIVLLSLDTTA